MNKVLKFRQTENCKVYITSDLHLNHNKPFVWEARGYKSSEEHTKLVIDKINSLVRSSDILIDLGDFCLNTDEKGCNELLSKIQCQNIYHIWGNHSNPLWRIYQNEVKKFIEHYETSMGNCLADCGEEIEIYPFRWRNIVFIGNYVEFVIDGKYFIGSHYPMYVFNYMKDNASHLCGHSHYNLELSQADNESSKILDVGWDGWGKPLTLEEVMTVMNKKKALVVDHHAKGK
jgi:calcineurin-like phosphoesterase family protein